MKNLFVVCSVLFITIFFGNYNGLAAATQTHYVGFQDHLLSIEDVLVTDDDMKVPLMEISAFLDFPVRTEKGITYILKSGVDISYNDITKLTLKDGIQLSLSPIVNVEGKLFISVKFIALEMGFKVEDFPTSNTLRIYQDDYKHMTSEDYEKYIKLLLNDKKTTKPIPVLTPSVKSKANVYLTFDDGPNKFTLLNNTTLKKYKVQGTFFFLGKNMKNNEKIVNTVAKDGHYIGTHSMTHDKSKVYKSPESFIGEMNAGVKLIHNMTGQNPKLLRVPYGSKPHVTAGMKNQLIKYGYKLWDWDVDSNDWRYTDKQADQIVKNVQIGVEKSYKSGDKEIIILLHDRSQTTKALPQIIEWLQNEGYTIKKYEQEHHIVQNFLRESAI